MDLLQGLSGFFGGTLGYLLPFLFVLTIVIFFHELGHFLVARWCGVRVLTFSLGFGPELFGRTDRHGTRWRVAAIPLGGYVKFYGDENAASATDFGQVREMSPAERRQSFFGQSVGRRAAIVAAGPIANFILAIVIFAMVFMTIGRPISEARVDQVQPESAASEAGFQPDDVIVSINGSAISSFAEMQRIVGVSPDRPLSVVVRRDAGEVTLTATPRRMEREDAFGNRMSVGVLGIQRSGGPDSVRIEEMGPIEALSAGVGETAFVVKQTLSYLGGIITGRESTDQLSGPIRIAQVSGQAAQLGFQVLFNLAAVLSVSIGLLNLFPIPLLDGGHLMYYAFEAIRGRPLSERAQEFGFRIGIAFVLMLMLVATWNDILHLTTS